MKKRWKITLGIVAGLAVVCTIVWMSPLARFIITGGLGTLKEQPFDAQPWKEAREGDLAAKRIRLLMLDDLLNNKLKTGTDSLTVKEMLGEPERQYGFSYALGTLAEGIDPVYLVLDFDSAGNLGKLNVVSEGKLNGKAGILEIEVKK